jgi:hypothetical protein
LLPFEFDRYGQNCEFAKQNVSAALASLGCSIRATVNLCRFIYLRHEGQKCSIKMKRLLSQFDGDNLVSVFLTTGTMVAASAFLRAKVSSS